MKRVLSIIALISLLLTLCACGSEKISLESVSKIAEEDLNAKLLGLSQEEIHEMWGQPDSFLSGLWGDIYLLPEDDRMIILYYETDITKAEQGKVIKIKITQRQA